MQYSDTANASFWTISSRIMATMSTFIINCTTKHQHKVEEVAPEESSIYWWKTSEISHFTFLCLNHRSFIRIFSNCRFLDQTWPCFNLHVTDPLRTVTEMSEALAEPCSAENIVAFSVTWSQATKSFATLVLQQNRSLGNLSTKTTFVMTLICQRKYAPRVTVHYVTRLTTNRSSFTLRSTLDPKSAAPRP